MLCVFYTTLVHNIVYRDTFVVVQHQCLVSLITRGRLFVFFLTIDVILCVCKLIHQLVLVVFIDCSLVFCL